jgi:rod shape-determining protein MreC
MVTVRRWWKSKLLQLGLVSLVVSSAWMLRQTQGYLLLEMYHILGSPLENLRTKPSSEERLNQVRLLELETRIADLESQNEQLKNLLGYIERSPFKSRPIPARVVGRSADHWWQQVILNRGSNAGIKEGFIVKTYGGLVGLVETVTPNTSRVLLISDLKSQVGVKINRTSSQGILRGDSSAEAVLEFYEKVPNVQVGDLVSTSPYSQKFPPGVPVGRVKSLDLQQSVASVAKVDLFPPIPSLDWVAVYPFVQMND